MQDRPEADVLAPSHIAEMFFPLHPARGSLDNPVLLNDAQAWESVGTEAFDDAEALRAWAGHADGPVAALGRLAVADPKLYRDLSDAAKSRVAREAEFHTDPLGYVGRLLDCDPTVGSITRATRRLDHSRLAMRARPRERRARRSRTSARRAGGVRSGQDPGDSDPDPPRPLLLLADERWGRVNAPMARALRRFTS